MIDPTSIAKAYIETWNAKDDRTRRALLGAHWTDDAAYADPLMGARGRDDIGRLVGAVHERFPAFRFALRGTPDGHGDYVRLAWSLGPAVGEAPIEGSDVVTLRAGRIAHVVGFIDRAPAA